ncbi:MAG: aldehyde dehydrogenase family protein [Pseudomonadota bacterium]
MQAFKLLINGQLVDGAETMPVLNPATEEKIADCPRASLDQLNEAVAAANAAFPAWSALSMKERAGYLNKLADKINENAEELARVLTSEQGKPVAEAAGEVAFAEGFIRATAALDLPNEVVEDSSERFVEKIRRPLGVVAGITPWNFPLLIIMFKMPAALLAGNTFVLKPAPTTPLSALKLAELCAEVFPAGVVNVIADANDLGGAITSHPDIRKVSFTGSTATGRKVMASAADTLKRLTLELGGNDAAIVLGDMDPKQAAQGLFQGAFWNCGQVCLAVKRAYVQENIYDQVCDELKELADAAIVDDGLKQGTQIGPLQNKMQYEKVKTFLDDARKDGNIIAGGEVSDRAGYFIRPTIVRDVTDGNRIVDEEQFGPVLPVIKFSDPEDALARANSSDYGLGGSVWSTDEGKARALAGRMDAGTVWINTHLDLNPAFPFGGSKQSGIGSQFAAEGLEEFTQLHVINMAR